MGQSVDGSRCYLACVVDRLRLVHHRRYTVCVPELCVVGHCLHVLLHHRRHHRCRIEHEPCVRCCCMVPGRCLFFSFGWTDDADCLQVVGYLAAGLVFTTLAVNSLVYQDESSKQAAAAGFILLSMVIVRTYSARCARGHRFADSTRRSFGSSTSARLLRLPIADSSIRSLSTKSSSSTILIATADPCRMPMVLRRATNLLRCTRRRN